MIVRKLPPRFIPCYRYRPHPPASTRRKFRPQICSISSSVNPARDRASVSRGSWEGSFKSSGGSVNPSKSDLDADTLDSAMLLEVLHGLHHERQPGLRVVGLGNPVIHEDDPDQASGVCGCPYLGVVRVHFAVG